MSKHYECTVSFSYDADNSVDAAQQFLDNLRMVTDWFIEVKDMESQNTVVVDTQEWDIKND